MTTLALPGYDLGETLYKGTRTLVYRSTRTCDNQPVIIKFLRNEYPTFSELVQFRNQYTIAKNLDLPGIVKPLVLETYGNGYALVMADEGYISLGEWQQRKFSEEFSIADFLIIAIQLAGILHGLYQNRVIHKDIKPANILIHPDTKRVKLIDFSIASLLPKETQEISNPNVLEGTLAYISPEQTGRMNRGIDYRTDFYSLGVTFYELLTGELPFQSDDPMELVHAHIAKSPTFETGGLGNGGMSTEEMPQVLSQLVLKLIAKNAEDRYQSALGLKYDLEKCLSQWKDTGKIESFKLGERDICDRFIIPEKLYGRDAEVQTLLDAFDRVANGVTEMMLVAGFSGIGKTAVVNEVHKPITRSRGYFIKGKFDQFNRNIPFSAFVQAFRDLMGQLLSESDEELANWKAKILETVGENGQVLIDVIPELERVIDVQPPAPELSGTAAQNQFNLLFQKFIAVFTTPEHPLVIFLDDLQWADSASLNLMKVLMGESERGYLLLLGAYRDNEVLPAHPLMLTLKELEKQAAAISTITLAPLPILEIERLVAETLSCSRELAQPLTELVYQKTKGNPFFTTQFLKGLQVDELIVFNGDLGYWECDLVRVRDAALTDDVVEFMVRLLQKLPQVTQDVLKLAACVGNQFDLETLAVVCETPSEEVAIELWSALQEGLLLPTSEAYKFFQGSLVESNVQTRTAGYRFLHDRVQQAAYSLIREEQRKITHFNIGTLLLEKTSEAQLEENVFNIVTHLNRAIELITSQEKQLQLAKLNLLAAQKAKSCTAHIAAWEYLEIGIQLLEDDCWQTQYHLALNLYTEAAEISYLNSDFEIMKEMAEIVLSHARNILDKFKIYETQVTCFSVQSQFREAIEIGLNCLKLLGIHLPLEPTDKEVEAWLERTQIALDRFSDEALIKLPDMTNREMKAAVGMLIREIAPIYLTSPNLFAVSMCQAVLLSLKYGNTVDAPVAFMTYGFVVCSPQFRDFSRGYRIGKIGEQLLNKHNNNPRKALALNNFYSHVSFWTQHYDRSIAPLQEAYQSGIDFGELEFAGYALTNQVLFQYCVGQELSSLMPEIKQSMEFCHSIQSEGTALYMTSLLQVVYNLTHVSEKPWGLHGEFCDETATTEILKSCNSLVISMYYFNQLYLNYLFSGDLDVVSCLSAVAEHLDAIAGHLLAPPLTFISGLSNLAVAGEAVGKQRKHYLQQAQKSSDRLQLWAGYAPMNFQHKWDLMQAEKCRVLGQKLEAIEFYDRAMSGARINGYIQEEALANELTAKLYLDWEKETVAAVYMQNAYYCYARWGAKAKIDRLEEQYPHLLAPILQKSEPLLTPSQTLNTSQSHRISTTTATSPIDFISAIKASLALSEEIELDALLSKLMQIVLENAGADKGALILNQSGTWVLAAQCANDRARLCSIPLDTADTLPLSIINTVKRTQQPQSIDNLEQDQTYTADPYLRQQPPKSLFCTPILNQGKLIGILYLENHLTAGAFTPARLEVLNLLVAQAAISIENAQLYKHLEEYSHNLEATVEQRTQELQENNQHLQQTLTKLQHTQAQLIQAEKMSALGQMVAGIAHEINNPISFIAGNVGHARSYFQDLNDLLELYEEECPAPSETLQELIEDIDLEFVKNDLGQLLCSMQTGSDRIRQIVLGLRNFSRLDESDMKRVDIHEGLENTLVMLQHRFTSQGERPEIKLHKHYGNLPPVHCWPSQLNQVFFNILTNAIDVLDALDASARPEIRIITEMQDDRTVRIRIADNGPGMSESIRQKVFDPFFTTKPVGRGTGLGLSISYQIVTEQHGGQLQCISQPGKGTEFVIEIPLLLYSSRQSN